LLVHDQRVDESQFLVVKRTRQTANKRKAEPLPQPHGTLIRGHNEIELHCPETQLHCPGLGMFAQAGAEAATLGRWRYDIPAVADMRTPAWLVGFDVVRAQELAVISTGYQRCAGNFDPGLVDVGLAAIRQEGIGVPRRKGGAKHGQQCWPIGGLKITDADHVVRSARTTLKGVANRYSRSAAATTTSNQMVMFIA